VTRWLLALLLLASASAMPAWALSDPAEQLPDAAQEQRARIIGRELRCLVCQNQSIEDSDAELARDLRRIVREQVAAGRSDGQVMAYLHDRYGDFVLLRPPFTAGTALLWATPVLALGAGALLVLGLRRRRAAPAPAALTAAEQARLAELDRLP
jgi:cytochrome c-type biogenesis protein CcmH